MVGANGIGLLISFSLLGLKIRFRRNWCGWATETEVDKQDDCRGG